MESTRSKGNRIIQQENLDNNHYKLEKIEETIKCGEAGKAVPQTEILVLQTKVQEREKLIKALQNEHQEMQQKLSENDTKIKSMSIYEYELLKNQADEIEQREELLSQSHEQNTRLQQKLTECEKMLREKNWEIKNTKIKLIKFQENDKNIESLEYRMQKLREELKNKDNRIKELGAVNKLNEGVIKDSKADNQKLKEQLEEKDIQTREMSNDYKQEIKDNMEEIQEVKRVKERETKKLTHTVNHLNIELEKYKQINKKVQYAQKQKDNMYLTLIIVFISWISIYPMSLYSWYHPGNLMIMVAFVVVIFNMLINVKSIWYDKYSGIKTN
ncbi:golgin subfamily A member 6-like protein 22 [Anneissia japonica]|uniref:golgin subfamily A member 6-like protein 22 n=1 Tax=Anneissia japonica TaxID=1529436 RepID=UPI00142559BE|nr:golgin subfamily A member 6-like protein 22 [Anneissia japonica]